MTRNVAILCVRTLLAVVVVVALLWHTLPLVAGVAWAPLATAAGSVPLTGLVLLAVLWAAGLALHTLTLTAALPRLTHLRALTLSLTGSAVANVLPFGGAAGVALNYRMVRSWGFDRGSFATYTVVTNIWDVLVKLTLPGIALAWLLVADATPSGSLRVTAIVAVVVLAVLSALLVAVVASPTVTHRFGTSLDATAGRLMALLRSQRRFDLGERLQRLHTDTAALAGRAWPRLTFGMLAYSTSLGVLLWGCLHLTGAGLPPHAVFAGFAVERLLTLAAVTPGGTGTVEVGLSGLLVLLGGAQIAVVAGVLLYRAFTYGLELPVGGAGLVAWWWRHRGVATTGVPA